MTLELRDYLRKCTAAKKIAFMDDWCSILSESEVEDEIVLGTAFMRDFITTFDGTLGRITLSQKTSQTCKELLSTTEQSMIPSIISGVVTLLVGLILGTKSLRGCL